MAADDSFVGACDLERDGNGVYGIFVYGDGSQIRRVRDSNGFCGRVRQLDHDAVDPQTRGPEELHVLADRPGVDVGLPPPVGDRAGAGPGGLAVGFAAGLAAAPVRDVRRPGAGDVPWRDQDQPPPAFR